MKRQVDELQVLEELLRQRLQAMQEQSFQDLQARAALIAENKQLKKQLLQQKRRKLSKNNGSVEDQEETDKPPHVDSANPDRGEQDHDDEDDNTQSDFDHFIYNCPVDGCQKTVKIHKDYNPPLNEDNKTVSDQVRWAGMDMQRFRQNMSNHMREKHKQVDERDWPLAFLLQKYVPSQK